MLLPFAGQRQSAGYFVEPDQWRADPHFLVGQLSFCSVPARIE